jgi:hypothetical protein
LLTRTFLEADPPERIEASKRSPHQQGFPAIAGCNFLFSQAVRAGALASRHRDVRHTFAQG